MRNDCKHIALEKIRDTLNLLRKSNLGNNSLTREDSLLQRLKSLQNVLRYDQRDVIDPYLVVEPFLAILRAPYLAGPFKLVALDALQTFTSCNLFSEIPISGGETLAKVVDAVTRCRFVQTDALGDELVQLQIMHTLSNILRNPVSCYLTDATAWDIISASHSILIHIAATGSVKSIVYQAAEKTIIEASRLVFSSAGQKSAQISDSTVDDNIASVDSNGPSCVCAVKVLKFFVGILHKFSSEGKGSTAGGASAKRSSVSLTQSPNGGGGGLNGSAPRHSGNLGFWGEYVNPETRELLFAIKAVHAIFLAGGDLHASRALISNHEPLAALVRDDLGRCLILLCSRRDLPPSVLQSALGLFSLTVQLLGPTTRILVECFMKFIYVKAILQVRVMFASHDEFMRLISETQSAKEVGNGGVQLTQPAAGAPSSFSIEELEIVLESLADLLADLGFLPSLFASFDCDPSKGDIVQPLVKYLSSCMRYTLVSEPSELALHGLQEVGALIEHCYGQLSITLNQRDALKTASSLLTTPVDKPSSRRSSTQHDMVDSDPASDAPSARVSGSEEVEWTQLARQLRLTRLAKGVLAEAALKFSNKPAEGLKFLQARGVLPTPLTPASVAKFLRIAPGLPNECTGSFLGELGKDNPSYEADGKAFHREVLLCYVRSFELKGQTVLNCMRIFLSAFRLPGEAQQIDRILVAFSEYCHAGSIEGNSGLLENPEVTYLLTFSMIMLNTDLHNPNVRADRKMTTVQFIKNNSFYGKELNQTKKIPKEYLETVYESLAQVPLRTERNDLNASITPEMWMDLQLQATINKEKGLLLSTSYTKLMISKMTKAAEVSADRVRGDSAAIPATDSTSSQPPNGSIDEIAKVARHLLTDSSSPDELGTLALCEKLAGVHWLVDKDFLACVFQDFFGVAVCPFVMHRYVVAPTAATVAPKVTAVSSSSHGHGAEGETVAAAEITYWRIRHASVRALDVSIDLSLLLLGLLHSNGMQAPLDALIVLLVEIAGVKVKDNLCQSILKSLALMDFDISDKGSNKSATPKAPIDGRLKAMSYRNSIGTGVDSSGVKGQLGDVMVEGLRTSIAARAALGTLLLVTHRCPSYLSRESWQVMWILLALLRDCSLLPASMIVVETGSSGDTDLLPVAYRTEFEMRLLAADRREVDAHLRQKNRLTPVSSYVKKSSSLLSLQGLGEALFGAGQADSAAGSQGPSYCTVPPRWDVGYDGVDCEEFETGSLDATASTGTAEVEVHLTNGEAGSSATPTADVFTAQSLSSNLGLNSTIILIGEKPKQGTSEYEDVKDILAAFITLREMVAACGIAQIISDTRFYSEDTLCYFFESLVAVTETADGFEHVRKRSESIKESSITLSAEKNSNCSVSTGLQAIMGELSDALLRSSSEAFVSPSSVTWLENLLVEASLRNRDRLSLFWTLLAQHYETTIKRTVLLTYPLERRVTSLFRLSARMINRDVFKDSILELFRLFVPSGKGSRDDIGDSKDEADGSAQGLGGDPAGKGDMVADLPHSAVAHPSLGLGVPLMLEMSGQVSAGMWRVLTTNLEVLPTLSLSQWQVIFDVIAVCAGAGGYASIKAFESMAWMLHESRLQGEIPMFCTVGIRPLLCNTRTTISVSVGAIKLLTHLHSRLEVLFTAEDDYVQVEVGVTPPSASSPNGGAEDSDTPLLWESCWTPILSAMAEGCEDSRKPVRLAASKALSAAILDRHVRNVPVGLMVKILGDFYITVVLHLAEFLVKEREKNIGSDSTPGSSGKESTSRKKNSKRNEVKDAPAAAAALPGKATDSASVSAVLEGDAVDESEFSVVPLMCTLCKVFVDQIKRLSTYPTFDRLWLRLIHVFGYMLGAPHGFDHAAAFSSKSQRLVLTDELHRTVAAAGDHLATLINLLIKSEVFLERPGLWVVTKESILQMAHRPSDLPIDSPEDLQASQVPQPTPENAAALVESETSMLTCK